MIVFQLAHKVRSLFYFNSLARYKTLFTPVPDGPLSTEVVSVNTVGTVGGVVTNSPTPGHLPASTQSESGCLNGLYSSVRMV